MNIFQLEEKLEEEPTSPLSVRLASLYVARTRVDEAIELCAGALERNPKYATAYTILSRCYAANRQFEAAIYCVEKSLSLLPDAEIPQRLLDNWRKSVITGDSENVLDSIKIRLEKPSGVLAPPETLELMDKVEKSEYTALTTIEENYQAVQDVAQPNITDTESQNIFPDISEFTPQRENTVAVVPSELATTNEDYTFIRNLIDESFSSSFQKSENDNIQNAPTADESIALEFPAPKQYTETEQKNYDYFDPEEISQTIVSKTLAEIYSKQGEYGEAIKIYKALILRRPKERDDFVNKIREIESKMNLK